MSGGELWSHWPFVIAVGRDSTETCVVVRTPCLFAVLGAPHIELAPLPFSWLIGMSHRMSHPTSTKDMSFMVCVTWLSGEPGQAFFHFCLREVSIGWHHTVPCLWSSIIFWHGLPPSSGEVFVFIMGTYYINNTRCSTVAGELGPCSGVLLEVCQHKVVLRTLVLTLQFPDAT